MLGAQADQVKEVVGRFISQKQQALPYMVLVVCRGDGDKHRAYLILNAVSLGSGSFFFSLSVVFKMGCLGLSCAPGCIRGWPWQDILGTCWPCRVPGRPDGTDRGRVALWEAAGHKEVGSVVS